MYKRMLEALQTFEQRHENRFWLMAIAVIWAILYLPDLGRMDFILEEGRRALCAREMSLNGDFIVPTVLGKPYYNKPPGFAWTILLFPYPMGGVNEWSVRMTSAIATAAMAALVFFFAREKVPARTRFLASALFLFTFMTLEKGRLGEIEAVFAAWIWGALWTWHKGIQAKGLWRMLSGLCLGAALLTKGPPALLFYYGAIIPYCYQTKRMSWLISSSHLLVLLISFSMFGAWFFQTDWRRAFETGIAEAAQRGGGGWIVFLEERAETFGSVFIGLLPASLFLPAYFWRRRWREEKEQPEEQTFLLCLIVSSYLFFFGYPGVRARYLYPIAPGLAFLAAIVWRKASDHGSLRWLGSLFSALLFPMGIAGWIVLFGLVKLRPALAFYWIALGALILILTILLARRWNRRFDFASALLQIALICCLAQMGVFVRGAKQELRSSIKQSAQTIASFVPKNQPLYTLFWDEFNLFYYAAPRTIYISSLEDLPHDNQLRYVIIRDKRDVQGLKQWKALDFSVVAAKNGDVWLLKIIPQK